jgi:hypothetical protein
VVADVEDQVSQKTVKPDANAEIPTIAVGADKMTLDAPVGQDLVGYSSDNERKELTHMQAAAQAKEQVKKPVMVEDDEDSLTDEDEAEVREALEEANEVLLEAEKTKLAYAQAEDKKYEDEVKETTKKYHDDKTKKGAFWQKVKPYNRPIWAIILGFIFCLG